MEYDGVQSKKAPSPPSAMKKVVDYIAGEIYGGSRAMRHAPNQPHACS